MPQLDPVVLFLQSSLLISFYLIFYFLFFRPFFFPIFFVNYKFTYYYLIYLYEYVTKLLYIYINFFFFYKFNLNLILKNYIDTISSILNTIIAIHYFKNFNYLFSIACNNNTNNDQMTFFNLKKNFFDIKKQDIFYILY